ncbi:MAG: SMP-30/gluconolactonase/LRE family protein [Acidobacteria bacterium]|nr:SMP-30/gluconolactonase/LRE family protein [Acidobacteriota bacterium]
MTPVTVATGIGGGEGPVWRPDHGDLIVTSLSEGWLFRIDLAAGTAERFADTAGGANGALLCADGGLLVAQNGRLDMSGWLPYDIPALRPTTPGVQRVNPDGVVTAVPTAHRLNFPNDIAVDVDGSVVFTDPEWKSLTGRLWRLSPAGQIELIEELPHYVNGVSAGPSGLATAEDAGLRWLRGDDRSWLSPSCGSVDGFAFDVEGRVYACQPGHGIVVVDPDGTVVEQLLAEPARVTNCCFGGDDLRTLFVTDAGTGSVLAWEGMPTPGHPLTAFVPTF